MKRAFFAWFFCCVAVAVAAQTANSPEVKVLVRTDTTVSGQPIVMPEHPTMVMSLATYAPGARVPVHKHPYPHAGYVLAGELTVYNEETGARKVLRKGDVHVEVINTWHWGRNEGKETVQVLTIEHLPKGVTSNVVLRDAKAGGGK